MKSKFSLSMFLLLTCLVTTFLTGCDSNSDVKGIYSTNIKKLHLCYMMYMENNDFVGPKNEKEFKDYLKNDATAIFLLKRVEVTPEIIDDLFVSDRDGKPFVIRYGVTREADHAVIFEDTGVEGTRLIALTNPLEVQDEQEYQDYLTGKIKPEFAPGGGGMTNDESEAAQRSSESQPTEE